MRSSRTITLFADPPPSSWRPSSFVFSILLHGLAIVVIAVGLKHTLRVEDRSTDQRYMVRLLNLRNVEPQRRRSPESGVTYAATQSLTRTAARGGGRPAAAPAPRHFAKMARARQILIQPDVPPNILLPQQATIPSVVMWLPDNTHVRKIVPPPPHQATASKVRPSLETPNHEPKLADLKISATVFNTTAPMLPPSTSSPLVVRGPEPPKQVTETASKPAGQPTPARVISLSDLQQQEGTIVLPLANESTPGSASGSLTPGRTESTAETGSGQRDSKQNGIGAGQKPGNQGDEEGIAAGSTQQTIAGLGAGQGSGTSSGVDDSDPAPAHITLPGDGQFAVVVVGSSLAEEYPETVKLWGGRLAYTVYLHVGETKSWILQYSLPRAAQAAAAGNVARPEAPWPYDIMRPHLAPGDYDADAVMVHGFVTTSGRFEQLAVVFPPQFPQTAFVLKALQQWKFRPALQNGKITTVEVLLIIPDEPE